MHTYTPPIQQHHYNKTKHITSYSSNATTNIAHQQLSLAAAVVAPVAAAVASVVAEWKTLQSFLSLAAACWSLVIQLYVYIKYIYNM